MNKLCVLAFCLALLLAGCNKDEYTRANDTLLKQNRKQALKEEKAAASAPKTPKRVQPKFAKSDPEKTAEPVKKQEPMQVLEPPKEPEKFPRREKLPEGEE